ncbi:winged helix DNA-binding domain-containing protein, partial [Ramicandelaber brevisporus]
ILTDVNNTEVIEWSNSGLSIVVVDSIKLSKTILPQYFKHNRYNSFIRQLNSHGFRKVTLLSNKTLDTYQHPHFQRSNPHLMRQIKR